MPLLAQLPVQTLVELCVDPAPGSQNSSNSSGNTAENERWRFQNQSSTSNALICPVRKYRQDELTSAYLLAHPSGFIRKYSGTTSTVTHQIRQLHTSVLKIKHCMLYDCIVTVEQERDVTYICAYHNWRRDPNLDDGRPTAPEHGHHHDGSEAPHRNKTRAYQLPLASLAIAEQEVLISVCADTGRVAVCEGSAINLYSCESGPFEHVCELHVVLPGHGHICDLQFLHPWLAVMSDNEVQVSFLDIIKSSATSGTDATNWSMESSILFSSDDEDDEVDFVFDGVSGRDIMVYSSWLVLCRYQ